MIYRYIIIAVLCVTANYVHAQVINPTELLQVYKNAVLKEPKFGLSAYHYIRTLDDRWNLQGKPDEDSQGVTVHYSFSKDQKAWYQPEVYHIMIVQQYGPPEQRTVLYRFKELATWISYNQQMTLMNAAKQDTRASQGGQQTIYTVNDIAIILTDFPPGINGAEETYQVSITQNH